jgi:hypothetical protein
MSRIIRSAALGAVLFAGVLAGAEAQAMPVQDLGPTASAATSVEKAYMVCGPFRCVRRGWGYGPGWGYGRGWRRPFRNNAYSWARPRRRSGRPEGSNH